MSYEKLLDEAYKTVHVNEESSRFEIIKVSGHHEGTKTIITNFGKVVAYLRRKPEHLLKFLGKELGIQGELSKDRLILSRKLPSKIINEKISEYSRQYVVCAKCGKPDTELSEENGKTFIRCLACGHKREVHKI